MATTYMSFLTALAAITVTGVRRKYTLAESPPGTVLAADMPAQFILPPGPTQSAAAKDMSGDYGRNMVGKLAILVNSVGLDNAPANYTSVVTLMDALHTALVAAAPTMVGDDMGAPSWTITTPVEDAWRIECVVTAVGI